ncbi:hypothetical protein [Blastopirellula marina]|uniref:Uncharacterized protein n=1 Tax=Blastopirellula marina DSM 3645 TaxID=314230 RepID=A3ZPJ2_9BACT|nr:hypothetical protein [Blastopirellula marina]EAQ81670.1 hypothetical protein DSM3645_28852 [Blastopirellula marina DSM 3645]
MAEERQLLDEETAELEKSQQIAALRQLAEQANLPSTRIHRRDLPQDIDNIPAWLTAHGKKGIVQDYEVTLRSGKGRPRVVSPVVAIDESEAISIAFASLKIENTQAYNPHVRRIDT